MSIFMGHDKPVIVKKGHACFAPAPMAQRRGG
jgi:hypothetical protein